MNYKEESSSEEADETFNSVYSDFSTPEAPLSPSHPNFLYQTSPPPTKQVLTDVVSKLKVVEVIQNVEPNWPSLEGEVEENFEDLDLNMVNFDAENGTDGEKAQDQARAIKVEFEPTDIKFWFS